MTGGLAGGVVGQGARTVALIAVVTAKGILAADYRIADDATEAQKCEIAKKLREIAAGFEGPPAQR